MFQFRVERRHILDVAQHIWVKLLQQILPFMFQCWVLMYMIFKICWACKYWLNNSFPECLSKVLRSNASQPGMISSPMGHLATSGAISGCDSLWGGTHCCHFLGGDQGCCKARWPALYDKALSGPNTVCAEVENPCFKTIVSHFGLSTSACCVMRVYWIWGNFRVSMDLFKVLWEFPVSVSLFVFCTHAFICLQCEK